jgi:hypothetical protein
MNIDLGMSLFYPLIYWRIFVREDGAFCSDRFSDFRIGLLAAPSRPIGQWQPAVFVPEYSGGPVPDFNGVPY